MTTLPITIGAALRSERLPEYAAWLIEGQRDLEIQDPAWPNYLDSDWEPRVKEIRSMLDGYTGRMGIHAPFYGLPLGSPDRKVQAACNERYKQSLDYCAALGGTHMVLHSPLNFLGTPFHPFESTSFNMSKILEETMGEMVRYAESLKIMLVIENIFDRDPALLAALVRSFNSEYVRMSVDTGHAHINYKLGAPPVDYFVREGGAHLGHVHLQDTDGFADRHWVPGEGEIRWVAVFEALSQLEHTPRMIVEIMDQSRVRDAVAFFAAHGWGR